MGKEQKQGDVRRPGRTASLSVLDAAMLFSMDTGEHRLPLFSKRKRKKKLLTFETVRRCEQKE